jgi:ribosomal protein S18 acetylase RimI-like enzyme
MNDFDIAPLQRSQIVNASEIAAKAFENDPVFGYLTPDDQELRLHALTWLTSKVIKHCIQYNDVYTTSGLQGVAAWLPPGHFSSSPLQLLRMVMQLQLYQSPFKFGWNRLGRWLACLSATEQAHQQDMGDQPHWYLAMMVVHPEFQGQGIGSKLLQPVLNQANHEGLPCYLVTFTEQAVRFYQKNGFQVVGERQFSRNSPTFWTLKRH